MQARPMFVSSEKMKGHRTFVPTVIFSSLPDISVFVWSNQGIPLTKTAPFFQSFGKTFAFENYVSAAVFSNLYSTQSLEWRLSSAEGRSLGTSITGRSDPTGVNLDFVDRGRHFIFRPNMLIAFDLRRTQCIFVAYLRMPCIF